MQIVKVYGPYKHARGYRLVVCCDDGSKNSRQFGTEKEAKAVKKEIIRQAAEQRSVSLQDALLIYRVYREGRGNRPDGINTTQTRLRDFFVDVEAPVASLTPKLCTARYEDMTIRPSARTRKPVAADTHRNTLAEARTFLSWCVNKGWLEKNPLHEVEGMGRRQHGKPQLRIDEGKLFADKALEFAALGQDGAVAALVALMMGMRASEIVSRQVRDLDDNGRYLVIEQTALFAGKTAAAARSPEVPKVLRPHLLRMASDKRPTDPLFGEHKRDWVLRWVGKICDQAGVPRVTTHGLRGMSSTLAVDSGLATYAVAAMLGHASPSITEQSYVQAGTRERRGRRELAARVGEPSEREDDEKL